jgi:hypothetical protein
VKFYLDKNPVLGMVCLQLLLIPARYMDLGMVLQAILPNEGMGYPCLSFYAKSDVALGEAC